jgi:putative ABC transport system substrate-binding protein
VDADEGGSGDSVRRTIIIGVIAWLFVVTGSTGQAQQPGKTARVAYLDAGTAAGSSELLDGFRKQMTQFGWIEGKNLTIEYRYAEGKGINRQTELVAEIVGLKVDVIVVDTSGAATAAKKVTSTIPIVMVSVGDPIGVGLIDNLARPGGNITGLASFSDELAGKRVEILKEVIPKATRFGVMAGPPGPGTQLQVKMMKESAPKLGLKLIELGAISDAESVLDVFQAAVRERVHAIITTSGNPLFGQRRAIIVLAASHKFPAIYPQKEFVEDGGLLAYGVDRRDQYRRAAVYVDKILRGTKPGDLPVERPMKFEFYANLKAAKQINFTIPPNVLVRADKVIK